MIKKQKTLHRAQTIVNNENSAVNITLPHSLLHDRDITKKKKNSIELTQNRHIDL